MLIEIELPLCKRCCLCFPLRSGLIAWGYARLVIASILTFGLTKTFCSMLTVVKNEPLTSNKAYIVILGLLIVLTLTDIVLNIIFVIGGHKKNLKLFKAYYVYSFVLWVLLTVIGVVLTIYTFYSFARKEPDLFRTYVLLIDVASLLVQIFIQAYFLLLVRSEINKLKGTTEFRFVNNAAESECTMKCDETAADREKQLDNVGENGKLETRVETELTN